MWKNTLEAEMKRKIKSIHQFLWEASKAAKKVSTLSVTLEEKINELDI